LAVREQSRTLGAMTRIALASLLVLLASSMSSAQAPRPSLVFVYDGGGAHISGDRLRRALAASLQRPVLRLTDEGADGAAGRITIAFSPPDRWVIDFVRGDAHTTRTIALRSSSVARLARVATTIVADMEPTTPAPAHGSSANRGEWIALISDEILDPFTSQPVVGRSRRSLALVQELVDPFGVVAARRRTYDDVIDPWSH